MSEKSNEAEKRNQSDIQLIFDKLDKIFEAQIRGEENHKKTNEHLKELNGTVAKHEKRLQTLETSKRVRGKLGKLGWFTFEKIIAIVSVILTAIILYNVGIG